MFKLGCLGLVSILLLAGCGEKPTPKQAAQLSSNSVAKTVLSAPTTTVSSGMEASPLDMTNFVRTYQARGVVREAPVKNTVMVQHEEIADYMPEMTMEFSVRDTNELRGLQVGDFITFLVKANSEESWIEGIKRGGKGELPPPLPPGPSAASLLSIAEMKVGDVLPDAELLAEDGRTIKLSDFRGRALAFTFIFTRCPLPDFCPRMNQNLNRAREILSQRTGAATNWQFLSISFDPEFDKAEVLQRYAYSYRGQNADRWMFASAPTNVMNSMVANLNFRFAREGRSFVHNLRTVVLDTQGRIHQQFDGNKWKAVELADSIAQAATIPSDVR